MDCAVTHRDETNTDHTEVPLVDLKTLDLKRLVPLRRPWATHRQSNTPGLYFFSRSKQLVYHESYLERRVLLVEDYAARANWVVAQPFCLHFEGSKHVPDFLLLTEDGPQLLDVRPRQFLHTEAFIAARAATTSAAARLGWGYEVRTEPEDQMFTNLDWLSGFRRRPPDHDQFATRAIKLLGKGSLTFDGLVSRVGHELFSKPTVFHLLWNGVFEFDIHAPLTGETRIDLRRGVTS